MTGAAQACALARWLIMAASISTEAPPPPVASVVRPIFADKAYAFCHDPHFPLTQEEFAWCPLLQGQSSKQLCPGFHHLCAAGATAAFRQRLARPQVELPTLPRWMRGGLLTGALVCLLGMLLFVIRTHHRFSPRLNKVDSPPDPRPTQPGIGHSAAAKRDVASLLAQADAEVLRGDPLAAVSTVYAAVLRHLEEAGVLAVEASHTNGDYLRRALSRRADLAPELPRFVRNVEAIQFGRQRPTSAEITALLRRGMALATRALLVILMISGAGCGDERGGWEHSPSGRAGVIEFLRAAGLNARERFRPLASVDAESAVLVLLPGASVTKDDWGALRRWVATDGGVLMIALGPHDYPPWVGGQIAESPTLEGPVEVGSSESPTGLCRSPLVIPAAPVVTPLHLAAAPDGLLTRRGRIYAQVRRLGKGQVLLFGSESLFTNVALLSDDNANYLRSLMSEAGSSIEFVGELTGLVAANPADSVRRGRLAPFMIQLLVTAALLFACRGSAFGRLREPPPASRRAFAQHVRAVGDQYARAGAAAHVRRAIGNHVVERLRERVRLIGSTSLSELAAAVALRTGRPVGAVMRLLLETRAIEAMETPPSRRDVGADLTTARELDNLLTEMGDPGERTRIQRPI